MANFYMTLTAGEISRQVAELLNAHNKLRKRHNLYTVLNENASYFVDIVGGHVIGCQAILQENVEMTKLFHLCVHPDWRRRGIARRLKLAALANVTTPYAYVTIREDNIPSIKLNMSLGFTLVKKDWVVDHNVLTLGKVMASDRQISTNSMDTGQSGQTENQSLFLTKYN